MPHLLTNENALGAEATAAEGKNRTHNQEGTDSTVSVHTPTTEPQPIPAWKVTLDVVLAVIGLALRFPKPGPVTLTVTTAAGRCFELATAATVEEITSFAKRHAEHLATILGPVEFESAPNGLIAAYAEDGELFFRGEELFYRWELPTPEPEPAVDEDDAELVELGRAVVGGHCLIIHDRLGDEHDGQVSFGAPGPDIEGPWVTPAEIPELVDRLLELHRAWRAVAA